MSDDFRARARPVPKGNRYEDFEPGRVFKHHWGRTVTESESTLFSTLTLHFNPHYYNAAYARAHGHQGIVVNPLLVFTTVFGLTVEDLSEGGGPFLGVNQLSYHQPVYPGDSLRAEVGRARSPRVGLPQGLRHRHLAHDWLEPARREGHRLQAHQPRSPKDGRLMPYITEERRMIQEQAREFTLNEVLPVANKLDPEKGDIPMDLRDKMAELGYFGILIPEQYGGLGLGCFEYCLVTEELSRGWMSVASLIARGNLLIGSHMMSEEQRARYLPRMAKGEFLGAFSMSEPNAGSDISNISCRAKKDGTGYLISGNKYWCTFADGADFLIVIARTSDAPAGQASSRPVDVLRREEARHAAQGRERRADSQDRLFRLEDLGARLRQLPRRGRAT